MKTQLALFVSMLLPFASACVVEQSPPPHRPPPPAGQAGPTPPPAYPGHPPAPPQGNPPPPSGNPPNVMGVWASPTCGSRTYPRKIQFNGDGTFEARDLVSPCPPKVACVWSGIAVNKGTYAASSGSIKLNVTQPGVGPNVKPLPAALAVDPPSGAPVEASPEGQSCAYGRDAAGM